MNTVTQETPVGTPVYIVTAATKPHAMTLIGWFANSSPIVCDGTWATVPGANNVYLDQQAANAAAAKRCRREAARLLLLAEELDGEEQ